MGRRLLRTPELARTFVSVTALLLEDGGPDALTTRAVADASGSSLAALNGLFGSKSGLLNAVALQGFSELLEALDATSTADRTKESVIELASAHRRFGAQRPELMAHMYSRPFASFDPGEDDLEVATAIRRHFTDRIASLLGSDRSTSAVFDTAVGLVALLDGLSNQERAGTLGSTTRNADSRWSSAIETYLAGASVRFSNVG